MKSKEDNYFKSLSSRFTPRVLIYIVLALILFFPYKTTIVPEWKISAVDDDGKRVPHAKFRQIWYNYSYDISGGETVESDENGCVVLPERAFYAPLIYRIPFSAIAYLMQLAHGSVGNDAALNAYDDKCSSKLLDYKEVKSLPEVIVIDCS